MTTCHRLAGPIILAIAALLGARTATGQVLLWEAFSPPSWGGGNYVGFFGSPSTPIRDVNGDGFTDVLVSHQPATPGGMNNAGAVGVFSGLSGQMIWSATGVAYENLSTCGEIGDSNGDGVGDLTILGRDAAGVPVLKYVSGANGAVLSTVYSGGPPCILLGIGDSNLNGIDEFLAITAGVCWILESVPPVVQMVLVEPNLSLLMFSHAQRIPDYDGDGVDDLLFGGPGSACTPSSGSLTPSVGRIRIYSRVTGLQLAEFLGDAVCDRFGLGLASVGDVSGDGVQDFVVAQPGLNQMKTIDGATGATIATSPWPAWCPTAWCNGRVVSVGDVDGDGSGDFAATHFPQGSQSVTVHRGIDHALIMTLPPIYFPAGIWPGPPIAMNHGNSLYALGDEDADGFEDLGVNYVGTIGVSGRVRKYSLRPPGTASFGQACGSGLQIAPRIGAAGSLSVGGVFKTTATRFELATEAALAIGVSNTTTGGFGALPYDLTPFGWAGCSLLVSPDLVFVVPTVPQMNGFRGASVTMTIPSLPALVGLTFYSQWAGADALSGDVVFTGGLAATIQP